MTRALVLGAACALTYMAVWLFVAANAGDGLDRFDWVRTGLIAVVTFWLSFSASSVLLGLSYRAPWAHRPVRARGMTAVLVPVFNENPAATFSRIAAMNRSLCAIEAEHLFHFVILSDTNRLDVAADEAVWFRRLVNEFGSQERLFYRRRKTNTGKKAGNIEDFILTSGAAYDYAVVLDADSLLEGQALVTLAARMEANPRLGLLQTVPTIIGAQSIFGRMIQFGSAYFSPAFTRGMSMMQASEGPFWGHNAIVRVRAFAASCGLPRLDGKPPFGGDILSHDYIEAALLVRNGWQVRVDPDIGGSFEEGPENLVEFAKRDRRWCQGNLQHVRLLATPGFRFWNRFTLTQGIMSYLVSPLLFLFLLTSIVSGLWPEMAAPAFRMRNADFSASILLLGVISLLILPRLLIMLQGMGSRNRTFGSTLRAAASVVAEIALSTMLAPILLVLQTRAVVEVLIGRDSGWPSTRRDQRELSFAQAWTISRLVVAIGATMLLAATLTNQAVALWLLPATLPMLLSPVVIKWTSRPMTMLRHVFATPQELNPSPVLTERDRILARWVDASQPVLGDKAVLPGVTAQARPTS